MTPGESRPPTTAFLIHHGKVFSVSEPRELWAKAPANLITDTDITPTAKIVYLWLDLRAGQRGYWYGARGVISEALGVSVRTVSTAIASLQDRGYITAIRSGQTDGVNRYTIAARSGNQLPIPDGSVGQLSAIGRATSRPTDETHPINHRPNHRPIKRLMHKTQTDWDAYGERMQAKIDGLLG